MIDISPQHPHVDIFTAPALPLGRDWTGLTYLHGAVERERSHLVVTDRDFGQAYLADAWATRFLMTMFETYVVRPASPPRCAQKSTLAVVLHASLPMWAFLPLFA